MTSNKVRKDCRYNEAEMFSILPYKEEFVSSSTHLRMVLLKKKILPSIFNYWLETGKEYNSEESKTLSKVVISKSIWNTFFKIKVYAGTHKMVLQ